MDPTLAKVRFARRLCPHVVVAGLPQLPVRDGAFPTVVCSQVLEHIPADPRNFAELLRVLSPGGQLILGTPDYGRRRWRLIEALYRVLIPGGYADKHITHYDRAGLELRLRSLGFEVLEARYIGGGELILRCRLLGPPHGKPASEYGR